MLQRAFSWTDQRVAELTKLAGQGCTAAIVAERFGITRSAVTGKAMRLGVSFGRLDSSPKAKTQVKAVNKQAQAPKTAWTAERISTAAKLWAGGLTAQAIAEELGCTANAFLFVVGKNRESFPKRLGSIGKRHDHCISLPKTFAFDSVPFHLPEFPGVRFVDLQAKDCRWPISNDAGADMLCCGAKATHGSYCGVHAAVSRGRGTESERRAPSIGRSA